MVVKRSEQQIKLAVHFSKQNHLKLDRTERLDGKNQKWKDTIGTHTTLEENQSIKRDWGMPTLKQFLLDTQMQLYVKHDVSSIATKLIRPRLQPLAEAQIYKILLLMERLTPHTLDSDIFEDFENNESQSRRAEQQISSVPIFHYF